jgi:hypothetical protein
MHSWRFSTLSGGKVDIPQAVPYCERLGDSIRPIHALHATTYSRANLSLIESTLISYSKLIARHIRRESQHQEKLKLFVFFPEFTPSSVDLVLPNPLPFPLQVSVYKANIPNSTRRKKPNPRSLPV